MLRQTALHKQGLS